jgi:hypothetical protein
VDEFQNFANETFAEILSESRKYKLNLIITNQYIEQMEEEVRNAVFGNVGTTVAFRVGPFDAETLETVFLPRFTKEDLGSLDKRQIYISLMIDGVGSAPFSAVTIPPIEAPPVSHKEKVTEESRKQFTAPRAGIENKIIEELAASTASEMPLDARMKKKTVHQTQLHVSAPATTPPMIEKRPNAPSFFPRPPIQQPNVPYVPRPVSQQKSAEDLKTILRNMTAKNGAEKEKKQEEHQQSLTSTLSGVLEKSNPASPLLQRDEQEAPSIKQEMPKTAAAEPPRGKQPFEVSEDKLRDVLKGDI